MKRTLCLALAIILLATLCACGSTQSAGGTTAAGENAETSSLMVGYSRRDITPQYSVPLAGYGNTSMRMSTGFQTYLFTTCVAFSDGEDTILVYQNDLSGASTSVVDSMRLKIEEKLGIPRMNIMIAGTHTHSAPDLGNSAEESITRYRGELEKNMLKAAEEALADLSPVSSITHGNAYPENLNFVRHYTTESGVAKGDNFGDLLDSPITGHTHKADNQLQVVRIDRTEADDVVLVNWQSHPHRGGGGKNTNITADIVGIMRDYVEAEVEGTKFIYFTGASGNINPSSRIASENITADYWEQGKALGSYAVEVLNGEMARLEGTNVQMHNSNYTGEVNHTEDHLVTYAREVSEIWAKNNNFIEAVTLANSYGINSPYHAGAIITKASMGDTLTIEINAFSVGDLSFVTAPYEMFDENGKAIKEGSPYPATFVITCCNSGTGYIPSQEGYANNCYGANTGRFKPGTGEILAEEYVKLLETIYATR